MAKLNAYFMPKKNVDYEIFQFRQAVQKPGEAVDQFTTRLRQLAARALQILRRSSEQLSPIQASATIWAQGRGYDPRQAIVKGPCIGGK